MLVLDGVLDPDAPIRHWIPELPAWAEPIRIRHLVDHTSGLPDEAVWTLGRSGAVRVWTNESVLSLVAGMPGPQADAGTVFSYSSIGYICLAMAAERAADEHLPAIAQRRIFTPLRMTATQFWTGPGMHPPTVTIHPPWYPGLPPAQTLGDGGVWSSVRDLLRWVEAMATAGLGSALADLLQQPGRLDDGTTVPYAWGNFVISGARVGYGHAGWWPGCCTYRIHVPSSGKAAALVAFVDDPKPVEALGRRLAGLDRGSVLDLVTRPSPMVQVAGARPSGWRRRVERNRLNPEILA